MSVQSYVLIVEFFLTVGAAWFAYGLYKRLRMDAFREELFTLRDDLFDYMWRRGLPYDNRAYGLLRNSLNGMIHAADDGSFNWATLAIQLRLLSDPKANARVKRLDEAIGAIPDLEVQRYFQSVLERVGWIGLRQIWFEGPIPLVMTPVLLTLLTRDWKDRKKEVAEVGVELYRKDNPELSPQAA